MALVRTHLFGAVSNGVGSFGAGNYVTGAFAPPNASLLVVGITLIENSAATSDPLAVLAVSGGGWTYTPRVGITVSPAFFPTATRIYTAPVTVGIPMALTISTGGLRNIAEYSVSVAAYTGYDLAAPTGATATGSQNGGFGPAPNPVNLTLSAPPAATSEVFAWIGMDKSPNPGVTPGAGWTELDEVLNIQWGGGQSQVRTGSTSASVDWADLRSGGGNLFNYAATALEVNAAPPPLVPADVDWCAQTPVTGWTAAEAATGWVASDLDATWRALTPEEDC